MQPYLTRLRRFLLPPRPEGTGPLDHPEIARMSARELADLPMPYPAELDAPARRDTATGEMPRGAFACPA